VNAQKRINASRCGSERKRKPCLDAQKPESEEPVSETQKRLNDEILRVAGVSHGWKSMKKEIARLINAGADVNAKNEWGGTVLICAAGGGDTKTCALLLEHGADIDATRHGMTALEHAEDNRRDKTTAFLTFAKYVDSSMGKGNFRMFLSDFRECVS
jgi:hypothetical protein